MSARDATGDGPSSKSGTRTGVGGTPVAVDVSRDRRNRAALAMFLSGPIIWSVHFMVVYIVVEAGCTGDGPGLSLFDPPVPTVVTLVTTAAAAAACVVCAAWGYRRWHASRREPMADEAPDLAGGLAQRDRGGTLAFATFLLALLGFVTVLFVGLPALILPAC